MFRSIQNKLYLYTLLLIVTVAALTYLIIFKYFSWAVVAGILLLFCLSELKRSYDKFNKNLVFLLNALDNGDYSFHFSETKLSRREQELNAILNRIKEILTNARKEVIENEKSLSIVMESVSTGVIIVDDRGIVQSVNKPALTILGMFNFTHLNQLKNINEEFPALFHNLKAKDAIQIQISNEREEQQISVRVSQILVKRGRVRIFTLNNIGNELESKEMESWIKLIRVMTHEIMNSVAPITSLTSTMLEQFRMAGSDLNDAELQENTLDAFETINTTARGLLSFVDSYRKFSAVPNPTCKDFPVKSLIEKNIRLVAGVAEAKGIRIFMEQAEDSQTLYADEQLIHQVLVNLIKNALEAVRPGTGRIRISVGLTADQRVRIDVANNGSPIPADLLPHIFIPFFTTKSGGSGIGLSVSRYIMRLHEGKLLHYVAPSGETVFSLIF